MSGFTLLIITIFGVILANGFWRTLVAFFFWPYSLYLIIKYILTDDEEETK